MKSEIIGIIEFEGNLKTKNKITQYSDILGYTDVIMVISLFLKNYLKIENRSSYYISIICVFILLGFGKEIYKKMFSELRLMGDYKYLKPMVEFIIMTYSFFNSNIEKMEVKEYVTSGYFIMTILSLIEVLENYKFDFFNLGKNNLNDIMEEAYNNALEIKYIDYIEDKEGLDKAGEKLSKTDILKFDKFKIITEWRR